jgi:hypothetical protein
MMSGLLSEGLRRYALPSFECAVECGGFGVSQQISYFADRKSLVVQVGVGCLASRVIHKLLKGNLGFGEAALQGAHRRR